MSAVSWSPSGSVFLGATAYTVTVTLTAGANYTFTGLTAATVNESSAVITANDGATVKLSYTFAATPKATLSGAVTVSGTAQFDAVLTAVTAGLTTNVTGFTDFGALSSQWKRGGEVITGAVNSTYKSVAADVGKTITVTVTAANCDGGVTSNATAAVTKANQNTPAAPTVASKTATSVTLTAVAGMEYRGAIGNWQSSPIFIGFTPDTNEDFYCRLAETATHAASPQSNFITVRTERASLSGAVSITGATKFGATLTADTSGLTTDVNGFTDFGTLSYQWKRGGVDIQGANSPVYILTAADIDETITVTVTAANCGGDVVSASVTVSKADGPAAPAGVTGGYTGDGAVFTYTVDAIADAEYSRDGSVWQDGNVFTGFTVADTAVTFFARIKATSTHLAGAGGSTGPVAFVKLGGGNAPALDYNVSGGDFPKTVVITAVAGAEYSFNGGANWSDVNTHTSTAAETLDLKIRLKETATHNASAASDETINTANQSQATPDAFTLTYTANAAVNYTVTPLMFSVAAAAFVRNAIVASRSPPEVINVGFSADIWSIFTVPSTLSAF
ncbi:hypothetical protein FACS1894211_14810 [Clostridia bacterium]|nr:hypothetical protein FACS1894211_14810 [Clostridia bacterium]